MSDIHQVLARKYRPQLFSEVVEQHTAVHALENAIRENRVGSAYLFFGPRGVGKTTIARILAKRINCENPKDAEPCDACESCLSIQKGYSMDVIEIDAASNRKIDDIRDLREKVKFRPIRGTKKVYIIDEVHMLTTEAFNALLKTLEEPPDHVVFVLATTELNKIPETILSRCQVFTFRKVPVTRLTRHLAEICRSENIVAEEDALFLIARKGDGSVRDSLSFLEQAVSFCDRNITSERIRELTGSFTIETFLQITSSLLDPAVGPDALIRPVVQIFDEGGDLERFVWEYMDFLRTALYIRRGVADSDFLGLSGHDVIRIQEGMKDVPPARLQQLFDDMFDLKGRAHQMRIRNSYEARILIEMTLLRVHEKMHRPSLDDVIQQLNHLSRVLEGEDVSEDRIFAERPKQEPSAPRSVPQPSSVSNAGPVAVQPPISPPISPPKPQEVPVAAPGESERKVFGDAGTKDFSIENELQKRVLGTLVEPDSLPDLKGSK